MTLKQIDETDLSAFIHTTLDQGDFLPVLSPGAIKIQSEALKKAPHFSTLAGLIRKDPTLTGRILKTANSPLYRGVMEVQTLKDALTRMGQVEMVNIIMAEIHKKNFGSSHPLIRTAQERLWTHCVACATLSLYTARHLALKEIIPQAFIAGLLHDMGKLHILTALEGLGRDSEITIQQLLDAGDPILADRHPDLGHRLLSRWGLPEQYRIIARDHHKTDLSDPLLVVVRISNYLCSFLAQGGGPEMIPRILESTDARFLGVDETWFTGASEIFHKI